MSAPRDRPRIRFQPEAVAELLNEHIAGALDERNDEETEIFWAEVAEMVSSGQHPHPNCIARGIARYGGPPRGPVAIYVAAMHAGRMRRPRGKPPGHRPTAERNREMREYYHGVLADTQELHDTNPDAYAKDHLGNWPSEVALMAVALKYNVEVDTARNIIRRRVPT